VGKGDITSLAGAGTGRQGAYHLHISPRQARAQAPAQSTSFDGLFHLNDTFLERLESNLLPG
jgi:hypothetical protein